MKPAALVGIVIFSVLLSALSARLLALASRTRRIPEFLLGLSTALPLAGYTFGFAGAAVGHGIPAHWVTEVAGSLVDLGFVATVLFVWQVFRRDERWAKGLSLVLSLSLLAMPLVNHWVPWDHGVPAAMIPRSIFRMICYCWAAFESLHYGRLMRKRVQFGLAEPLVADRFNLWGLAHVCLSLMLLLLMAGVRLHFSGSDFDQTCTLTGFVIGLLAAIPLALSFFPTEGYIRHVEARYRRGGLI